MLLLCALAHALPSPDTPPLATEELWGSWTVEFDGEAATFEGWGEDTPHRAFGRLDVGPVVSPRDASGAAWDLLEQNESLLGVPVEDLRLALVDHQHGQWVVLFDRTHAGLPVEGAQVDVRIRDGHLQMLSVDTFPWPVGSLDSTGDVWVPLDGALHQASFEEVHEPGVWEHWWFQDGEPIAYVDLVREFTGQLTAEVDDRSPAYEATHSLPLPLLELGGVITATDGTLDLQSEFSASTSLIGRYIELRGAPGSSFNQTMAVNASNRVATLTATGDDLSYLDIYVYGNAVSQRVREIDYGNDWARHRVPAYANISSTCNAYFDGWSINFYRAGGGCNNTGRIADVIYHEFGHGTHYSAIVSGSFDGAVSEGASDYLSATMNDDSALAPGFFGSTSALRDADNDKMYPQHLTGEVHADGEIYVAAVWHLREALLLRHGRWIGTERADAYWYATLQGTHNMTDAYGEAILRADDDGDLTNGVRDGCLIAEAFERHGLLWGPRVHSSLELSHVPASQELKVQVTSCGTTPTEVWAEFEDGTVVDLSSDGVFWTAPMPSAEGVRTYTVHATDGADHVEGTWSIPIGPVKTLSCTSFEEDWGGFSSGAISMETGMRALDEWQRGKPKGRAGDPVRARHGDKVAGMDLSNGFGDGDGRYEANAQFWLKSPELPVEGTNPRLRFWTKLALEDDYDTAWLVVDGERVDVSSSDDWAFWEFPVTGDTTSLELWLQSDAGVEHGGWSLDHVCVVADADPQATPEDDRPGWRPDGSGAMVSTCGCGTSGQPMGALVLLALAVVRRFR